MAHEVIKRVGKRAYRYRVETYRDAETRKVRSRWTYLGVAPGAGADAAAAPVARRAPAQTRERLIGAFERLAAARPYSELTAGMVATEAGLAHGTFYRYFSDKRAVLTAALDQIREQIERERPTFDPPYGTSDQERGRVQAWLETSLSLPAEHPGALRAYFELLESDEALREKRAQRTTERIDALAAYLECLTREGTIVLEQPRPLATALIALTDAVFRDAALAQTALDPQAVAGVTGVYDRAIFSRGA